MTGLRSVVGVGMGLRVCCQRIARGLLEDCQRIARGLPEDCQRTCQRIARGWPEDLLADFTNCLYLHYPFTCNLHSFLLLPSTVVFSFSFVYHYGFLRARRR